MSAGYSAYSQSCDNLRYRDSIFDVEKHGDIVFATVQGLPSVYVSENVTVSQDLVMDIFEPADDTLSKRPLVIFAFGGGFLIGGKNDEDAQAYCDSLARTGYVTASIQYRIGMNIASPESAVRAIYRAAQDYSAAVRYLKEFASAYRIDTNYIFTGGVSAGSFSAMNLAYMQDADRPVETFASGGLTPAPDLGCIDCSGNGYRHTTKAKALVNCWGAILDTSWISLEDNTPLISFHGDIDPVVPFGTGFPFTALFLMPEVHGSQPITSRATNIGLYNRFHPFAGQGHNVWGTVVANAFVGGPTPYFDTIISETKEFLYPFLKPIAPVVSGVFNICMGDTIVYSVIQNPGSSFCWEVIGGAIVSQNPQSNQVSVLWPDAGQGSIAVQEINYLHAISDTAFFTVAIDECIMGFEPDADNHTFVIFPNPVLSGTEISLRLGRDTITRARLMDLNGHIILDKNISGESFLKIPSLAKGFYVISFYNAHGIYNTEKLVVE